jgi:hypothetical protein
MVHCLIACCEVSLVKPVVVFLFYSLGAESVSHGPSTPPFAWHHPLNSVLELMIDCDEFY